MPPVFWAGSFFFLWGRPDRLPGRLPVDLSVGEWYQKQAGLVGFFLFLDAGSAILLADSPRFCRGAAGSKRGACWNLDRR